jgi:CheY-like chemotaxis protein
MTVLIAEDNVPMRGMIREIVRPYFDEIVECGNGAEAVRVCESNSPDLVLLDVMMPKMDGIQAAREIHLLNPDLRIVMVTDYGDVELQQMARESGASGFVRKDDLLVLREICGGS